MKLLKSLKIFYMCKPGMGTHIIPAAEAFPKDMDPNHVPPAMLTSLEANLIPLRVVAYLACFGAVGLFVATASLADALPGWRRQLATSAGTAVAVLSAAYLVTTTAAADVVTGGLSDPGPGVVEATLVSLQTLGITRYAATVALASLGVLAGDRLPRWMRIAAGVLAVAAMGTPVAWVAALLAPVWLGLAGALCRRRP